jgi:hypothetical protein
VRSLHTLLRQARDVVAALASLRLDSLGRGADGLAAELATLLQGGILGLVDHAALLQRAVDVLEGFANRAEEAAALHLAVVHPIGTADYGSRCFFVNDMSVSAKFGIPSDLAKIAEASRHAIERDEPDALTQQRGRGIELDHQNPGGFAAINKLFVMKHTPKTILQHIAKPNGSSRYCLTEPLLSEFIELHRQQTDSWALLKALPRAEHQSLTKKRRLDDD